MKDRRHLFLWPVLVVGIALIVFPFATSMPAKTNAGQMLLSDVRPVMNAAGVAQMAGDAWDAFVGSGLKTRAQQALAERAPGVAGPLFAAVDTAEAGAQRLLGPKLDALAAGAMDFQGLGDLSALRYLTWAFVVPGVLLVLLAGVPITLGWRRQVLTSRL